MTDANKDNYRKLSLNITYYRREKKLSQIQLAEMINVSRTHMSRIENGSSAVSLDTVFNIARALDLPVHMLFEFR